MTVPSLPRRARPDGERGAVAVLTAILVSSVLFVVGALAVDLGSAWAERVTVRTAAEAAALAGARLLPEYPDPMDSETAVAETDARTAAAEALCRQPNPPADWRSPGVCPSGGGLPAWASDGDPDNGEIDVVTSQEYPLVDTTKGELAPRVLRVLTPPVTVRLGLGAIAGADDVPVRGSASARHGLPYPPDRPVGAAPFYLTLEDLKNPSYDGICLRLTPRTSTTWPTAPAPDPDPANPSSAWLQLGSLSSTSVTTQTPQPLRITGATMGPRQGSTVTSGEVTVYVGQRDAAHRATTTTVTRDPGPTSATTDDRYTIDLTTPDFSAAPVYGSGVPVWFELADGATTYVSTSSTLTYPSRPGAARDCDPVGDGRGLVDLAREDGSQGTGAATRADVLSGLDTRLHPFGGWPDGQGTPATDVDCYDAPKIGTLQVRPASPPASGEFVRDANCVPLRRGSSVATADLTAGWLGLGTSDGKGRLHRLCSPETGTISDVPGTLDATNLFRTSNGLISTSVSSTGLRDRIRYGRAANGQYRGAILEKVFDCPRLLLVPVLDTKRPPKGTVAGPDGHYPVVGLTYFWVSDRFYEPVRAQRGIVRDTNKQVVGIRGWVVDPAYVRGGDWVDRTENPDTALPVSAPKAAVLVRAPGDDHPDSRP